MQGEDEDSKRFGTSGALEPPYNPRVLVQLFEHSNSLRQNVDAYSTNIDGFGHRYEPAIDLDKPEADQRIAQAIYQERMHARGKPGVDPSIVALPLRMGCCEVRTVHACQSYSQVRRGVRSQHRRVGRGIAKAHQWLKADGPGCEGLSC